MVHDVQSKIFPLVIRLLFQQAFYDNGQIYQWGSYCMSAYVQMPIAALMEVLSNME